MPSTPIYAWPYAGLSDTPNGPTQQQALALAIETDVARGDTQESQQVFTANGTYTKPAGLKGAWVYVQAGGGGGGAAGGTAAAQASVGGGGGGGEWACAYIPASSMGATVAVTVGAAGAASGAGSGTPGGTGGTTSFGALLTAIGGSGGAYGAAASIVVTAGGAGGTGGGGTATNVLRIPGQVGHAARTITGEPMPAPGGSSRFGDGGAIATGTNTAPGRAGTGYGGGGGGALLRASQASAAGGAGAPGVCVVRNVF